MGKVLHALYEGDVFPAESIVSTAPEYRSTCSRAGEMVTHLREALSKADLEVFDSLMDLQLEIAYLEEAASFSYGFKLGVQIIIEICADEV